MVKSGICESVLHLGHWTVVVPQAWCAPSVPHDPRDRANDPDHDDDGGDVHMRYLDPLAASTKCFLEAN